MSTDADPDGSTGTRVADPGGDDAATRAAGRRGQTGRVAREDLGLLLGLPVIVVLVLGGWVLWRLNADLDDIESRQLAWGPVISLTWEHVKLTLAATVAVLVTAIPTGILLTRPGLRRFAAPVTGFANAGQAAPVIGIIVLLAIWLGFGFWTAVLALSVYAFLPVLRNTIVGLEGVDATLVEAARGMGMSQSGVLSRVELPLALPVIMTGVRTALVLLVGTATFGTFINAGGLGALITTGITLFRYPILISGALLVALLALLVDWAGRVLEMLATPRGM